VARRPFGHAARGGDRRARDRGRGGIKVFPLVLIVWFGLTGRRRAVAFTLVGMLAAAS